MKSTELISEFSRYPLFTINDVEDFVGMGKRGYAKLLVHRLMKNGILFHISKGIYTLHNDPLIFGTHITYPSYFSLWTALRYYDITTQLPNEIYVMSPRSKKDLVFVGERIDFLKTKLMWGYHKENYMNFEIFMADKEKLVIDALYFKAVPFYEVTAAIKVCNKKRLADYCIKANKRSIIKRVGYVLERIGCPSSALLDHARDRNIIPLNPLLPKRGRIDRNWCVYINEAIE